MAGYVDFEGRAGYASGGELMKKLPWDKDEEVMGFRYAARGTFVHKTNTTWNIYLDKPHLSKMGVFFIDGKGGTFLGTYADFASLFYNAKWVYDPTDITICKRAMQELARYKGNLELLQSIPFEAWQAALLIMYDVFENELPKR